jgi:hypothetical protein
MAAPLFDPSEDTGEIRCLILSDKGIRSADLQQLAGLTNLEILILGGNEGIRNIGLKWLSGLTSLRMLNLAGTSITDSGMRHLTSLVQLEILNVSATYVTARGLRWLDGLQQLKVVCEPIEYHLLSEPFHFRADFSRPEWANPGDEIYIDYRLSADKSLLVALLQHASMRAQQAGFRKPVEHVILAFWPEGGRLRIAFANSNGLAPADQHEVVTQNDGYRESSEHTSFQCDYTISSWMLLRNACPPIFTRVRENDPPIGMTIDEWDQYALGPRELVDAIGCWLVRLVAEEFQTCFQGLALADPCRIVIGEDDDTDVWWFVTIGDGEIRIEKDNKLCSLSG